MVSIIIGCVVFIVIFFVVLEVYDGWKEVQEEKKKNGQG